MTEDTGLSEPLNDFDGLCDVGGSEMDALVNRANGKTSVLFDYVREGTPKTTLVEGDQFLRFLNTYNNAWFLKYKEWECSAPGVKAYVPSPKVIGERDLFGDIMNYFYAHPETRPLLYRGDNHPDGANKDGFRFKYAWRAILVAAKMENGRLSPFGILRVTLKKPDRKVNGVLKRNEPSWGDPLLELPKAVHDDPLDPTSNGQPRWGDIYNVLTGRLVKCTIGGIGTIGISATWSPIDDVFSAEGQRISKVMPLAERGADGKLAALPQYADVLKRLPNINHALNIPNLEKQRELILRFVKAELRPWAEKVMAMSADDVYVEADKLKNPKMHAVAGSKLPPVSAANVNSAQVQQPTAAPVIISDREAVYLEMVRQLGDKAKDLSRDVVFRLVDMKIIQPANVAFFAKLSPEQLKAMAGM